jgi:hypothetical protein
MTARVDPEATQRIRLQLPARTKRIAGCAEHDTPFIVALMAKIRHIQLGSEGGGNAFQETKGVEFMGGILSTGKQSLLLIETIESPSLDCCEHWSLPANARRLSTALTSSPPCE